MSKPKAPKRRIRQNQWDNWYGYLGRYKVRIFFNTGQGTQESDAKAWAAGDDTKGIPY